MSSSTPASVVSGVAYPIQNVAGGPCTELRDFVDQTEFVIDNAGPYVAKGCGRFDGDGVRFYEKDDEGLGRDIRVWRIVRTSDGEFTAEHVVRI